MRYEDMTEDQKWEAIELLEEKWQTEDIPEIKEQVLKCNENVSDEARRIHKESILIDACTFDVVRYGWRLKAAGLTAMNCTVPGTWSDQGDALRCIMSYHALPKDDSRFKLILTVGDIIEAKKNGQTGLIIGSQCPSFLMAADIQNCVDVFQLLGLRVCQIAYNFRTFFADGCFSPANAGLSDSGIDLIHAMEKAGVTVDLSHVGERSTLEALDMATKPMIFSHSNPIKLFNHPRNITDEQAKKCAATGGVVGVSTYNITLWDGKNFPTIDTFMDCLEYYCDLIGVDHVGIGLDTTATEGAYVKSDIVYFNKLVRRVLGENAITYQAYKAGRGAALGNTLEGLMCLANWVNLIDAMLKRGFSEVEIKKLAGENWMRVFRETWK